MSEVMAIESIVAEYARFQGYFVETRVGVKTKKGAHSDIDVLGFKQDGNLKEALLVECKACGTAGSYPDHHTKNQVKYIKNLFKKLIERWKWISKEEEQDQRWKKTLKRAGKITLWVVIGGSFNDTTKKTMLENKIKKQYMKVKTIKDVRIIPIHEILLGIIKEVREGKNERGKRYDNAALEFCRWLLRACEHNSIDSIDLDASLIKKIGTNYKKYTRFTEALKLKYFKECLKVVDKNAEKRCAEKYTRKKVLQALARLGKRTLDELADESSLKRSSVVAGLGPWKELGIVAKLKEGRQDKYFIIDSFRDIVKKELKKTIL
ncbi:MAG: hypothetical protein WCY36_08180 [Candidatus Omnitrophota bacterium]